MSRLLFDAAVGVTATCAFIGAGCGFIAGASASTRYCLRSDSAQSNVAFIMTAPALIFAGAAAGTAAGLIAGAVSPVITPIYFGHKYVEWLKQSSVS